MRDEPAHYPNAGRYIRDYSGRRDELSRQRRDLPWEVVNKEYVFEGPHGKQTLPKLLTEEAS